MVLTASDASIAEANARFSDVAQYLELDPVSRQRLTEPALAFTETIVLPRDDGTVTEHRVSFVSFFRRETTVLTEMHLVTVVDPGALASRAMTVAWQCSMLDVPWCGGVVGVEIDGEACSPGEVMRLAGVLAQRWNLIESVTRVSPAEVVSAMRPYHRTALAEAKNRDGFSEPARRGNTAAADAVAMALEGLRLSGTLPYAPTAAIHGGGPTAAMVADALIEGGIRTAPVQAFGAAGVESLSAAVDVIFLCAGSERVDAQAAVQVRAAVVVEVEPQALTSRAESALERRRIRVVPDVVTTAASAAGSNAAMSARLSELLPAVYRRLWREAVESGRSLRQVGMAYAVRGQLAQRQLWR